MTAPAVHGGDRRKASRIRGGKMMNRIGAVVWPKANKAAAHIRPTRTPTSTREAWAS